MAIKGSGGLWSGGPVKKGLLWLVFKASASSLQLFLLCDRDFVYLLSSAVASGAVSGQLG